MEEMQRLKIESRDKTTKAVVVTIIAVAWLVFIDPTDVFPVVGWIDDGGLLYCAWKCILAAKQHKELIKRTFQEVDNKVTKVEASVKSVKDSNKRMSAQKENTSNTLAKLEKF